MMMVSYTAWPVQEAKKEKADRRDAESLPGHFAVWAASDQASFLHGRFVWASWDVNELQSGQARQRIDNDAAYLRLGVHGL